MDVAEQKSSLLDLDATSDSPEDLMLRTSRGNFVDVPVLGAVLRTPQFLYRPCERHVDRLDTDRILPKYYCAHRCYLESLVESNENMPSLAPLLESTKAVSSCLKLRTLKHKTQVFGPIDMKLELLQVEHDRSRSASVTHSNLITEDLEPLSKDHWSDEPLLISLATKTTLQRDVDTMPEIAQSFDPACLHLSLNHFVEMAGDEDIAERIPSRDYKDCTEDVLDENIPETSNLVWQYSQDGVVLPLPRAEQGFILCFTFVRLDQQKQPGSRCLWLEDSRPALHATKKLSQSFLERFNVINESAASTAEIGDAHLILSQFCGSASLASASRPWSLMIVVLRPGEARTAFLRNQVRLAKRCIVLYETDESRVAPCNDHQESPRDLLCALQTLRPTFTVILSDEWLNFVEETKPNIIEYKLGGHVQMAAQLIESFAQPCLSRLWRDMREGSAAAHMTAELKALSIDDLKDAVPRLQALVQGAPQFSSAAQDALLLHALRSAYDYAIAGGVQVAANFAHEAASHYDLDALRKLAKELAALAPGEKENILKHQALQHVHTSSTLIITDTVAECASIKGMKGLEGAHVVAATEFEQVEMLDQFDQIVELTRSSSSCLQPNVCLSLLRAAGAQKLRRVLIRPQVDEPSVGPSQSITAQLKQCRRGRTMRVDECIEALTDSEGVTLNVVDMSSLDDEEVVLHLVDLAACVNAPQAAKSVRLEMPQSLTTALLPQASRIVRLIESYSYLKDRLTPSVHLLR